MSHRFSKGVSKEATPAEIRRAYRRKAAKLHPDRNKDDPKANEKFIKLGQAYQVLTDPEKRKEYDQFGREYVERKEKGGGGGGGEGGFDGFDIFKQFFGGGGGGSGDFRFEFRHDGGSEDFGGFGGGFGGFGGGFDGGFDNGPMFAEDSPVIRLDDRFYKKDVMKSKSAWLIMYYSSGCSHCHHLAPVVDKVARKLKHIVKVGAVDCEDSERACKHISTVPVLMLFNGDEDDDRRFSDGIEYHGGKSDKKLAQFVLRNLPSNVVHIKHFSAYNKEFVIGSQYLQLPTCILFSTKKSIPPLFSALSREYARDFDFVFVSKADGAEARKIMDALNVKDSELPLLLIQNFVIPGARNERLSGSDMSFEKMSEFLTSYSLAMQQLKKFGRKKKIALHHDEKVYALEEGNFDELCPKSADWLCVIGLDVSSAGLQNLKNMASLFVKDRLKMMYFLPGAESQLYEALKKEIRGGVSSDTVIVFNRKRGRLSESKQGVLGKEGDVRVFLESILSGSGKFYGVNKILAKA